MNKGILLLLGIGLFLGCQNAPQSAEADEPVVEETAAPESSRPDPQNPANENNAVPADWMVRLDTPDPEAIIGADKDSSDIFFVNMVPGWHVTTGPAAIFYHPENTASGSYEAVLEVHLFDPGERREAFGLILGGQNLNAENQTYDYFLLRNSGEFLIKRRVGEDTELIQDWTPTEAMVRYTESSESSVLNKLSVQVSETEVAFVVNDETVATLPKESLNTDGIVGMRINHGLNVHVSNLEVIEG